jgi:hypothetical protein
MHLFLFSLVIDGASDAPLTAIFDAMPSFDRLIEAFHATDSSISKEKMAAKLAAEGLSDKTMAQSAILLARARADGHWPSIENRVTDGSLFVMQLLQLHHAQLLPASLNHLRRGARRKNAN